VGKATAEDPAAQQTDGSSAKYILMFKKSAGNV
jgi:hypothetical protein